MEQSLLYQKLRAGKTIEAEIGLYEML